MQAVAADLDEVLERIEPATDRGDALGVGLVVHRVGERHAHDVAAPDLLGPGEAELRELGLGQLDELVVVHGPHRQLLRGEI